MATGASGTLSRKFDSTQDAAAAPPAPRQSWGLAEVPLALLGSVVLAIYVPWGLVFRDSIPGGGDNPSHPVLMQMIGEALFGHGHLVHYAYGFWGGFEAFQ